ncbi:putative glycoside hydrolase [Jeotgalibaca sp. A127]|uniref:putative glycoside hydrolase n=1 Tax=Jeotgalibaca sp. A127 TaxID=3457324 RepID=UPI003FD59997
MKKFGKRILAASILLSTIYTPVQAAEESAPTELILRQQPFLAAPEMAKMPKKFLYDSGIDIAYPEDGVKGIYLTENTAANPERVEELIAYLNSNDLNAMVIDIKNDNGHVTADFNSEDAHIKKNTVPVIADIDALMERLEEEQIYPIARIVAFKDSVLAEEEPHMSFLNPDGSIWAYGNGELFINPFLKETWDYAVNVGIEAAKAGFKEVQFDYVRFPEIFSNDANGLYYDMGEFADLDMDPTEKRVKAITDFVAYAREKLMPYGVEVSVDIFGYAATVDEASGIGQDFSQISNNVDVISSMIYPSHWGPGYFGLSAPDLYPYELVDEYMKVELPLLESLDHTPTTRPWLQDFTASYLGSGYYREYGHAEVMAQVQALKDHGVTEFLLWNAGNVYSY